MVTRYLTAITSGVLFSVSLLPGCSWNPSVWSKSKNSDTPLFRFVVNGRFGAGYIDRQGKIVIQPGFSAGGNNGGGFFEGFANVSTEMGGSFYIDATGSRVAPSRYQHSGDFSEGLATLQIPDENKYAYVDHTGRIAIPARFEVAKGFSEGLAAVRVGERYGYIDHTGNLVIPERFAYASEFADGHALVIKDGPCNRMEYGPCEIDPYSVPDILTMPNASPASRQRCRYSVIDRSGKILFGGIYIDAKNFSEGLAPMGDGSHWGYVDYSGEVRIRMQFEDAEPFSGGLARVRVNGKTGFIDKTGEMVIQPQFFHAEDFSEGLAVVMDEHHNYSFIDRSGKRAIAGDFDGASGFVFGLAHVRVGRDYYSAKWSYIDKKGNVIFTYSDQPRGQPSIP